MENKKRLPKYTATLELKGTDKIKQDLKEIEDSLERILSQYEELKEVLNKLFCLKRGENNGYLK